MGKCHEFAMNWYMEGLDGGKGRGNQVNTT